MRKQARATSSLKTKKCLLNPIWISYLIGRQLVKLKFISLVNLILNKEEVTELIQGDFNTKKIEVFF